MMGLALAALLALAARDVARPRPPLARRGSLGLRVDRRRRPRGDGRAGPRRRAIPSRRGVAALGAAPLLARPRGAGACAAAPHAARRRAPRPSSPPTRATPRPPRSAGPPEARRRRPGAGPRRRAGAATASARCGRAPAGVAGRGCSSRRPRCAPSATWTSAMASCEVDRGARQPHVLHRREQLAAQARLDHVGQEEGVLDAAAELVEVDQHDERRDAARLLGDRDHHLLLVGRVERRGRPGGRGAGAGAGRRPPGCAAAGPAPRPRRRRGRGPGAGSPRTPGTPRARRRPRRRAATRSAPTSSGGHGGEDLLDHRLDQVGAAQADDGARDPLGRRRRRGSPRRRRGGRARARRPPGRRGRRRCPRGTRPPRRARARGARPGRSRPSAARGASSPWRWAITAASYQSSGSPCGKAARAAGRAPARSGPTRARMRARWRRAAGTRSGTWRRSDRQQAPLREGRVGRALGREQVGDVGLERVDLLVGEARPRGARRDRPSRGGSRRPPRPAPSPSGRPAVRSASGDAAATPAQTVPRWVIGRREPGRPGSCAAPAARSTASRSAASSVGRAAGGGTALGRR